MGWQTDLFCNITFNRKTYNSIYEVESDIEDTEKMIRYLEGRIKALALMTEPDKFFSSEEGEEKIDVMAAVSKEVSECLGELEENYIYLYKLQLLREKWDDCHNERGQAVSPPENIGWDTAFLDGDFVDSTRNASINETNIG